MSEKIRVPFILSVAVSILFTFLSFLCGAGYIESARTALSSLPLIIFILNIESGKKFRRVLVTVIAYCTVSVLYCVFSPFPFPFSPVAAFSRTMPLIALTAFREKGGRKGMFPFPLVLIMAVLTYSALRKTVNDWYYLYLQVDDYPSFMFYSKITFIFTFLVVISEEIFRTERNYLSAFFLLAAAFSSFLTEKAFHFQAVSCEQALLYILILLIYMGRKTERIKKGEKRSITFSSISFENLEPLRKKKKPGVYEIPPNVPENDG